MIWFLLPLLFGVGLSVLVLLAQLKGDTSWS